MWKDLSDPELAKALSKAGVGPAGVREAVRDRLDPGMARYISMLLPTTESPKA